MNESDISADCIRLRKYKTVSDNIIDRLGGTIAEIQRIELLKKMQNESDVLKSCTDHDSENADCTACRFLLKVHKQVANLSLETLQAKPE